MNLQSELLTGLGHDELEALAAGLLALPTQNRLDELLAKSGVESLTPEETAELDRLLLQADQLTILKTRARYTLERTRAEAVGA